MAGVMAGLNAYISHRRGFQVDEVVPLRELPRITGKAFPVLLMPAILLYGIYGGVTTSTEAAAVAAAYALLLSTLVYRSLSFKEFRAVMIDNVKSSASVGLVIGGALILNYIVASENIPTLLANELKGLNIAPLTFMFAVNALLLALGCLLDASTIILVILPLFIASCNMLGIDLVYFGVVAVVNCMIGLITPPYGILLFVINGTTGISLAAMIKEIWPFIIVLVAALVLMIIFPQLVLWLPQAMGYVGK